jgi:hypothetical protein
MVQRTLSRVLSIQVDLETAKQREGLATMLQTGLRQIDGQGKSKTCWCSQNVLILFWPVTLATYTHKLAPTDFIGAAFMSIRSHRAVSLDVPLCLRMMSTADFILRMQKLHSANHLGDQDNSWRIVVHALSQVAQAGPDQPWLLPIYLLSCVPRILGSIGPHETLLIDSLAFVISSALRLGLFIDRALVIGAHEPSILIAERFSQFLKKGASPDAMTSKSALLKSLQSSQLFCSHFPSFS